MNAEVFQDFLKSFLVLGLLLLYSFSVSLVNNFSNRSCCIKPKEHKWWA